MMQYCCITPLSKPLIASLQFSNNLWLTMVYVHQGLIELDRIPLTGRFDNSFDANLEQLVSLIRPCLVCDAEGNPRPKRQLVQVS